MKLSCPICGAKLYNNQVCKYCKNVTQESIVNSSNRLAKQQIKNKDRQNVYYTNYLPSDINKKKLWLLTILLGWIGVQNFYVGKYSKGLFCVITMSFLVVFESVKILSINFGWRIENGINVISSFFAFLGAIVFLLYLFDIFGLIFKTFKVPVVLGENKK